MRVSTMDHIKSVEKDEKNEEDNIMKKKVEKDKGKGMVVLPYVQGLSDTTSRIMKKYKVSTAMKPHNTIKRSKVKSQKMCEGMYSIACENCNATYIGETKCTFVTCIKEHKEDVEKPSANRPYT